MVDERASFGKQVTLKAARKLRAQAAGSQTLWFGVGMFGLIGWSIAVPTVLGAGIGLWWDRHHPGRHSWTLALLTAGLVLGCFSAWHWVAQQNRAMDQDHE